MDLPYDPESVLLCISTKLRGKNEWKYISMQNVVHEYSFQLYYSSPKLSKRPSVGEEKKKK